MTLNNTTQEKIDAAVFQIKQHIINEIENHVDDELNSSSNNAVQNRVIFEEIDDISDTIIWILENVEDVTELKQQIEELQNKPSVTQEDINKWNSCLTQNEVDKRIESYLEEITEKLGE